MKNKYVTVTVDRPLGSRHPKYPETVYSVNYGYIEGTTAPDGMEQDAYILGIDKPVSSFAGKIIAVIKRENDIEDKWVVAPDGEEFTKEDIERLTAFQEKYFTSKVVMV